MGLPGGGSFRNPKQRAQPCAFRTSTFKRLNSGLPRWLSGEESACQCRRCGFDPLEKEMATHSSILAWEIPLTEEPGELQSMGSHRFRHG